MKKKLFAAALLAAAFCGAADGFCGDTKQYRAKLDEIAKKSDICADKAVSTMDMLECQRAEVKAMDGLLNETYKALRNDIKRNSNYAETLKKAQQDWIKLRDEAILHTVKSSGGTIAPVLGNEVHIKMLANRIELFILLIPTPLED